MSNRIYDFFDFDTNVSYTPTTPNTNSTSLYYIKYNSIDFIVSIDEYNNEFYQSLDYGDDKLLTFDTNKWINYNNLSYSNNTLNMFNNLRICSQSKSYLFYLDYNNSNIGIDTNTPSPGSSFDINSNKPILLTRLTQTQIDNITSYTYNYGILTYNKTNYIFESNVETDGLSTSSWRSLTNNLNTRGSGIQIINNAGSYNVKSVDHLIVCDTSIGAITINLPTSPLNEEHYTIKFFKGLNTLTIDGGSILIESLSTMNLLLNESVTVIYYSPDNKWYRIVS